MCDYSLHGIKNRLAEEGERLTVHKFFTGSKGLAAPAEVLCSQAAGASGQTWWERAKTYFRNVARQPTPWQENHRAVTAVCIPPGAQLELQDIPTHLQRQYSVSACEDVTFKQLNAEAFRYRDAVCFKNGQEVLLQALPEGLQVEVLQLTSTEELELPLAQLNDISQLVYVTNPSWAVSR